MDNKFADSLNFAMAAPSVALYLGELDTPGYWRRNSVRCLSLFAGFLSLYILASVLGYELSPQLGQLVVFWPAAGLLCGVLSSTPLRTWPLWLVAAVAGRLLIVFPLFDDRSLPIEIAFGLASSAEAIVFAGLIRAPLQQSYRLNRPLYMLAILIAVTVAATAVGGVLGSVTSELTAMGNAGSFWDSWRIWVAGDFLGIIIVAPTVAWLLLPQIRFPQSHNNLTDYALLFALVIGLVYIGIATDSSEGSYRGAVSAVVVLGLLAAMAWSVISFAYPISSMIQFIVTTSVIWTATRGIGPFDIGPNASFAAAAEMQIYLISTILALLLLAFSLMERDRALQELKLHRGVGSVLVSLTEKLVAADSDRLDVSIEEVLNEIAEFSHADRCVLLQTDRTRMLVEKTHSWTRPGVDAPSNFLTNTDLRKLPWVMQQFREHGYFVLEDLTRNLPKGADELREFQRMANGIESAVCVGLFADDELIGVIGCSYALPGVRWNAESLSLMYLIGQLFANVLTRKNAERVIDFHQLKLRSLATEIAISEERARRRTAVDLHDGIGQNLAVARMKIGHLLATSSGKTDELEEVRNLVDEALRGTRYIIADLSPAVLYELGLYPALQSLAERFEPANDLTCIVEEHGDPWEPGNDMRIALYRAVQEFLNNVARHAQAQKVVISVDWREDRVDIEVRDDGVGFDADKVSEHATMSSGFGLFSVRESINLLGGTLNIDSSLGLGSRVRLCVPRGDKEGDE